MTGFCDGDESQFAVRVVVIVGTCLLSSLTCSSLFIFIALISHPPSVLESVFCVHWLAILVVSERLPHVDDGGGGGVYGSVHRFFPVDLTICTPFHLVDLMVTVVVTVVLPFYSANDLVVTSVYFSRLLDLCDFDHLVVQICTPFHLVDLMVTVVVTVVVTLGFPVIFHGASGEYWGKPRSWWW
ncbi:hypothetical protein QVD17_17789 [Tagetes erecta]|uniref:Uncharacterized protein n=1 Tax=Tagetes erecta TaxID=13708 RepID=A0AAD8KWS4_TARER|nr:hypothetical protein QVD17_17789 [Tagetes erecta]